VAQRGRRDALWSLQRALGEARELIYIEIVQFAPTAVNKRGMPAHMLDQAQVIIDRMTARRDVRVLVALPWDTDFAHSGPPMNFETFVQQAIGARKALVAKVPNIISDELAVFHPLALPGLLRPRDRGRLFEETAPVPPRPDGGQAGRAGRDGVRQRDGGMGALALPRTAFGVICNLLGEGGAGLIKPLWDGYNPDVIPATVDEADPDGTDGIKLFDTLTGSLAKA
jgi:hypothetical protein